MPNKQYERGRRFEYRCRDALRDAGWHVWRTPASKSPADLIALRDGHKPLLVQCKTEREQFKRSEVVALHELAQECGAHALLGARGNRRGEILWQAVLNNGPLYLGVLRSLDDFVEYVKGAGDG
jgi:Holliday junction resolvase